MADLTEQNVTLVKTVEELEQEALNRVALLESHMPQKKVNISCLEREKERVIGMQYAVFRQYISITGYDSVY